MWFLSSHVKAGNGDRSISGKKERINVGSSWAASASSQWCGFSTDIFKEIADVILGNQRVLRSAVGWRLALVSL